MIDLKQFEAIALNQPAHVDRELGHIGGQRGGNRKAVVGLWILPGRSHHTGFSQNLTVEHMQDFAEMAGMEFVLIGAETSIPEIRKELRWNDLYYMMAAGVR